MGWGRIGAAAQFRNRPDRARAPVSGAGLARLVYPVAIFCLRVRNPGYCPGAFASRLPARIGRVFHEFQILLWNEEAAEHFIAAPFEKQRLSGKRPGRRFKTGKCDFHHTSDRGAQLLGKPVRVLRAEARAARVRPRCKQREVQIAC